MKIKINKLIVLFLVFLADSIFAMEYNFDNTKKRECEEDNRETKRQKTDDQKSLENGEIKIDFTKILPQEIVQEILGFCVGDYKYPKVEDAEEHNDFLNIKTVSKKLNLIVKNFIAKKKIEFKKYDDINKPLFDELHKISKKTDYNFVLELIRNGADINFQDEQGYTTLSWAAYEGKTEIVKKLIAYNADVNIQDNNEDESGNTALMMAARDNRVDI